MSSLLFTFVETSKRRYTEIEIEQIGFAFDGGVQDTSYACVKHVATSERIVHSN